MWRRTRQGPAKAHREHGPHTRTISQQQRIASIVRSPNRHTPAGNPCFPADNPRFAAAMAQERRPVPFRTRKLRPGTAMVLHSTGCGRVARRRITRTGSPDTLKVPGLPLYPEPAPARTRTGTGTSPHTRTQTGHPGTHTATGPRSAARTTPLKEESQKPLGPRQEYPVGAQCVLGGNPLNTR